MCIRDSAYGGCVPTGADAAQRAAALRRDRGAAAGRPAARGLRPQLGAVDAMTDAAGVGSIAEEAAKRVEAVQTWVRAARAGDESVAGPLGHLFGAGDRLVPGPG